jgi:hypothetical protein
MIDDFRDIWAVLCVQIWVLIVKARLGCGITAFGLDGKDFCSVLAVLPLALWRIRKAQWFVRRRLTRDGS